MNTKNLILIGFILLLTACSHDKPLQAPCSYDNRNKCGPVIPLQTNI